jgi:HK97 family phage portal protein
MSFQQTQNRIPMRFLRALTGKRGKVQGRKDFAAELAQGQGAMRSYMVMPGQPVWMTRNYFKFSEEAYVRNVIAYRAIEMVAVAAASVPFDLISVGGRGARRELKAHPLLDLLQKPKPAACGTEFFQALYKYRLISGNAFVQAAGPSGWAPSELYLLRPDRVVIIAGKGMMPGAYRYTVGDVVKDFPVDGMKGTSSILHLKSFHPVNDWYGLSPVEAAAYSIDQHNQAGAWNQALLQNGARPSGALVVRPEGTAGGVLSEDQYSRVKQQIDEQFMGPANASRPLLLEGGLDWKERSLSPQDMDFVQAKHASARDIAQAFGVPPAAVGDSGGQYLFQFTGGEAGAVGADGGAAGDGHGGRAFGMVFGQVWGKADAGAEHRRGFSAGAAQPSGVGPGGEGEFPHR